MPSGQRELATEHELLRSHLTGLVADVHRLDPLARADVPDAVHQLRVALRKLRAALTTFDKCFDPDAAGPVREDLGWLGGVLGRPRDLEVMRERIARLRGRPDPWLDSRLRAAHRDAHREAIDAMTSDRYFSLVDALDAWRTSPPWSDLRDRPAEKRLGKALEREWSRMEKAADDAAVAGPEDRLTLLHDVRKAAKRSRYAATALEPVLGSEARAKARRAKQVQDLLGVLHDTVVARDQVLALAETAHDDGRDTLTLGLLAARLDSDIADLEQQFERIRAS